MILQTVKYFNNEAYEANKYDEYLKSKFYLKTSTVAYSFWLKWSSEKWENVRQ